MDSDREPQDTDADPNGRSPLSRWRRRAYWAVIACGSAAWLLLLIWSIDRDADSALTVVGIATWSGILLYAMFAIVLAVLTRSGRQPGPVYGTVSGMVFAAVAVALTVASLLTDAVDPLAPLSFVAGFVLAWILSKGARAA